MIDQANTVGQTMSVYYTEMDRQSSSIGQMNSLLTQMDNIEAGCNGPNGQVNTSSVLNELNQLGISLPTSRTARRSAKPPRA